MASSLIPSQPLFLFTRLQSLCSLQDFAPNQPLSCTTQLPFSTRSFPSADKCAVIALIVKANPPLTLCSLQLCPVSSHPTFSPLCLLSPLQSRFVSTTPLKLHCSSLQCYPLWHLQRSVSCHFIPPLNCICIVDKSLWFPPTCIAALS